jgi:outer membrane protein TolC
LSALAAQRLERARQQLEFARTRLEVGTATASDLLRAEIEVGNAELAVLDAAASFRTAVLNLGRWIGMAGGVQPVAEALPDRAPALPEAGVLVQRAVRSSPLVVSSGAELEGERFDQLAGYSGYLPQVELLGGYDWSAVDFPPDHRSWNVSLSATLPIFDQFRREATLQRDAGFVRLARARSRDARIAAQVAVESSLQEVEAAEQRVRISERARDLALEDLRVLEERYQAEAATILDLQASQVALTETEIGAVRARQALGTALAELEAVLGESIEEVGND